MCALVSGHTFGTTLVPKEAGERAHGAQSPDAGTQGRGHTEPRRQHSGETAHGARSPDVGTQGRGHTEPRRGHSGERAHGAQIRALRGDSTRSPPRSPDAGAGKRLPVSLTWASALKMPFVLCVLSRTSCTQWGPLHLPLQHHCPAVASKAGTSVWLLPGRARSAPPRSSPVLPGPPW